jgi:hypothetical protein
MTKLSRMDSSSSSLKYSIITCLLENFRGGSYLDDFMEEEDDFDSVGVSFCQGKEVEITVSDVEVLRVLEKIMKKGGGGRYIDTLMRNARGRSCIVLLCIKQQRHEFLDGRQGDVATVVAGKQRLALEVEEEDSRGHRGSEYSKVVELDSGVWTRSIGS